MDCSTPGLPVYHQLPESTQTHVHWVSDAIQPMMASHPLSSPSPPTFKLFQHQQLFKWVSSFHQMSKVLEFQLQHQSFQWIFRTDFLYDGLVVSLCSPRDSEESSPTLQFKSINFSVVSFLYSPTFTSTHDFLEALLTLSKTIALTRWTFVGKVTSLLFNMLSRFVTAFKGQASFNLMAAVTVCRDSGVQESKICHCFHFFPTYLPCFRALGPFPGGQSRCWPISCFQI